jgi:hypothetical protein
VGKQSVFFSLCLSLKCLGLFTLNKLKCSRQAIFLLVRIFFFFPLLISSSFSQGNKEEKKRLKNEKNHLLSGFSYEYVSMG